MASTGHNVIDHLEDGDERQYKAADYAETRRTTGVNVQGYKSEGKHFFPGSPRPLLDTAVLTSTQPIRCRR